MIKKISITCLSLFMSVILVTAATPILLKAKNNRSVSIKNNRKTIVSAEPISKVAKNTNVLSVPYFYSFENADITTAGWLITDASNLMITDYDNSSPYGNYALISDYNSSASRAAWAFSPAVSLKAGVEYHVSIYVIAPGYGTDKDEFKITVGTNQTSATQTTVIIDKSGANAAVYDTWTLVKGNFTVSADGDYNFGINHGTVALDVEAVEFDGFAINAGTDFVYPPIAHVYSANGGLWSATKDTIYVSPNEAMSFQSVTKDATSRIWSFTDATPSISNDSIVNVVFNTDGVNTVAFEAGGVGGKNTIQNDYNVIRPSNGISDLIWNATPEDGFTVSTVATNAYIVGLAGTYWRRVGEAYTLPSNVTVSLNSVSFYVGDYAISSATNYNKNVVINIYPLN
ncbi:MAG: hypothetical protein ACOYM7_01835, partial [Paludibacter sp.]